MTRNNFAGKENDRKCDQNFNWGVGDREDSKHRECQRNTMSDSEGRDCLDDCPEVVQQKKKAQHKK